MNGLLDAQEFLKHFVQYLEANDLVVAKRSEVKVGQLRNQYLRRKSLTYKEIADAQLWGVRSKTRVEAIAKEKVQENEKFKQGNAFKIRMPAVERVGKSRGTM